MEFIFGCSGIKLAVCYASLLLSMMFCGWVLRASELTLVFRCLCLGAKCCKWILPLLMVFYAWTTDIVYPTTVIWFWCSYHTYLQWFWLHIREEPVFLARHAFQFQFQKMSCSFVEFVKRCDVFETFLLVFECRLDVTTLTSKSFGRFSVLDVASVATFVLKRKFVFLVIFPSQGSGNNQ